MTGLRRYLARIALIVLAAGAVAVLPPPAVSLAQVASAAPERVLPASIEFADKGREVQDPMKPFLDRVVGALKADEQIRIQNLAYAGGIGDDPAQTRRMSLMRAISVRGYLIEHGVRAQRIDVRALGNRSGGIEPADRVDIVALDR
jgi:outer membrane protein OmpA-like peptidoglycan-associated protein